MKSIFLSLWMAGLIYADSNSRDYVRFEKWLSNVKEVAPHYGLVLKDRDEGEEEWFYLYFWQSDDHSIERAIRETKKAWAK